MKLDSDEAMYQVSIQNNGDFKKKHRMEQTLSLFRNKKNKSEIKARDIAHNFKEFLSGTATCY